MDEVIIPLTGTAPALRILAWSSASPKQFIPQFLWHQLSHMDLRWDRAWDTFVEAISQCTTVISIKLKSSHSPRDTNIETMLPVALPHLGRLQIEAPDSSLYKLFSKFSFPALMFLWIKIKRVGPFDALSTELDDDYYHLFDYFSNSDHRSITILKAQDPWFPTRLLPEFFKPCLTWLPSVELLISSGQWDDVAYRAIRQMSVEAGEDEDFFQVFDGNGNVLVQWLKFGPHEHLMELSRNLEILRAVTVSQGQNKRFLGIPEWLQFYTSD